MSERSNFPPAKLSRRDLFRAAGLATGGAMLLGLLDLLGNVLPEAAAAVDVRALTSSVTGLELDNQFVDHLKSADGGFPKGEVIAEGIAQIPFPNKHLGQIKMQDIVIECEAIMPKPLSDWVAALLRAAPQRKSGALLTADFNHTEQSRLQFNNAMISEFTIPTLDAASKDPVFLTIRIAPELTVPSAGNGNKLPGVLGARSKAALSSNFRLTIPGLDCSRVSRIEALTVKQLFTQDAIGNLRNVQKQPARLEFPNLAIMVPEAFAGSFYSWFQDTVMKGNAGEQSEKSGMLELLDPTLKNAVQAFTLHHLGIFGFTPMKTVSGTDAIRMVKVEMYCEQITLGVGKA